MYQKIISVTIQNIEELIGTEIIVPSQTSDYKAIKGIRPQRDYKGIFLPELFNAAPFLSPLGFLKDYLSECGIVTNAEAFTSINSYLRLSNYTFSKKNTLWYYAMPTAEMFLWVDSYMKVAAENDFESADHTKLLRSMQFWAALVKMSSPREETAYFLRNMDVLSANFINRICLGYGFQQEVVLANESLEKAMLRNAVYLQALRQMPEMRDLKKLLTAGIYSGGGNCLKVIDIKNLTEHNLVECAQKLTQQIQEEVKSPLRIDDAQEFLDKALTAQNLVYVPDDNGEIVFDLALLQLLTEYNPKLKISIIINQNFVSNNADIRTLTALLNDPFFNKLAERSSFLEINSCLEVPIAGDLKENDKEIVKNSDVVMVKGQMFFEFCDMWNLNPNTYHFFVVSSTASAMLTGVNKTEAIVAHISSADDKYIIEAKKEVVMTLLDIRAEKSDMTSLNMR